MIARFARSARGLFRPRPLAREEEAFLDEVFGSSLDLSAIRVSGGGQPTGRTAWQPFFARVQFADSCFEQHDPRAPLLISAYPILAHEALHVWQRVHRHCVVHVSVDGLWLGAFHGRRAYHYDRSLTAPEAVLAEFVRGNIERQGQMFEDYVRSNIADATARDIRFSQVAAYVRAAGRLAANASDLGA